MEKHAKFANFPVYLDFRAYSDHLTYLAYQFNVVLFRSIDVFVFVKLQVFVKLVCVSLSWVIYYSKFDKHQDLIFISRVSW